MIVLLGGLTAVPTYADDLPDMERVVGQVDLDVTNIEKDIVRLAREIDNPVTRSRYYPLEKRMLDARVHFELRNFAQAAVLYMDATENPRFRSHKDRWSVFFRLGISLYELKNYEAAKEYFAKVLTPGSGDYFQKGLQYLIEVALDAKRNTELADLLVQVERLTFRLPATQYAYGKGLYRLGRKDDASRILNQVPATAPEYVAAQYYSGVIHTDQERLEQAEATFKRVVAVPLNDDIPKQREIRELAIMALGRLNVEMGDQTKAIDFYQQISRQSKLFYTSLYEMSWAYVKDEKFGKALGTLEILLLAVEDEGLATKANVLQGQLNIRLDQTDDAVGTYNEIIRRFGPIRDELQSFGQDTNSVRSFFRWLLDRHVDAFQLDAVLSDRAVHWLESDEELKEVIDLFDEMSKERKDVKESKQMLEALEQALTSPNRLEIFPKLKRRWTHISVAENQLIALSQHILNVQGMLLRESMTSAEKKRYDRLLNERALAEARFERMPKSVADYKERRKNIDTRFVQLRREIFVAETALKQVQKQLQSMEKWLLDSRYAEEGRRLSRAEQKKYIEDVKSEKIALKQVYDELVRATAQVDRENARVGVGDVVTQNETNIKNQLIASHRKQELLLSRIRERIRGQDRQATERLQRYRGRVVTMFNRLGRLLRRINKTADVQIADFRRQVARERTLLMGYERQVAHFAKDSDRLADEVGTSLFGMAQRRLSDVVLEADLGLIDVAWQKKETESKKIVAMQEARKAELDRLQQTMEEILKD